MTNSQFLGNRAALGGNGGACYIGLPEQLYFDGCIFTGNSAGSSSGNSSSGGALYINGGPAVVLFGNCSFTNNRCDNDGGAVFATQAYMQMNLDTKFTNNYATKNGGAISISTGSLLFLGGSMYNNTANKYGGGLSAENSDFVRISQVTSTKNNAQGYGGAVYLNKCQHVEVSKSYFMNNTAILSGGGIYGHDTTPDGISVLLSSFSNNVAASGGAIATDTDLSGSGSNFTLNYAYQNGGALYASYTGNLSSINFSGNHALGMGGAAFLSGSPSFFLTSCTCTQNRADNQGGAIAATYVEELVVRDTQFADNLAPGGQGGAIFADNSFFDMNDGTVSGNTATFGGGFYFSRSPQVLVTGTVVTKNSAKNGGGAYIDSLSGGTITAATFNYNHANESGGGVYILPAFTVSGGIIENNTSPLGNGIYIASINAQQNLTVINVQLSNASPFMFCCQGAPQNIFDKLLCDYPSCNKECGNVTSGCKCPPIVPVNCSCDPAQHTLGSFCDIPDQCYENPLCIGGCGHDVNFNFACCQNGANYSKVYNNCTDIDECQLHLDNCDKNAKCVNVPNTFNCICNTPLTGNGTYCTACFDGACFRGVSCETNGTEYVCGNCPLGFSGTGYGPTGCADIDECAPPTRKCDNHVDCQNTVGSVICGPCPEGFNGTGDTSCIALCGNGRCEPEHGEQCVTCPLDCLPPCGHCGDGHCDSQVESCTSCNEDCGTCNPTKCPGSNDCSHHGTCVDGLCVCTGPWGGPACNHDNSNITLNVTSSDPGFTVTSTNSIVFTITFSEMREVDQAGNIISSINLATRNYTFSQVNNTQNSSSPSTAACDHCDLSTYVHTTGGTKNKQYVSNNQLDNNATIEFMIWQFLEDDTVVTFANKETHFAANTIKLAVQIRNWPFRALQHSLALVMDSEVNSEASTCVGTGEDENRNLKWFTLYVDGVTLYGQFLNRTILDGQFRQVGFKLDGEKSVIALLPHFWVNAVVDPSFSVLLGADDTGCKSNKSKKTTRLVEILVPICVFLAVAVVVTILLLPRIRSYISMKLSKRRLEEIPSSDKKEVEIEKIDHMEVNSASGKYQLHL
eukprot:Phypoly_transcript_01233.p1 GENE.Phypoly_transcript_01233~~Phypoly_transcript_01233.p1  ORF type:complete len:1169 (+),score=148.62 Phypoly_transcript_01233:270-3509(+)